MEVKTPPDPERIDEDRTVQVKDKGNFLPVQSTAFASASKDKDCDLVIVMI